MAAIKGFLIRLQQDSKQTAGRFVLYHGADPVFQATALELPWMDNQRNISCIPEGVYKCVTRESEKYDRHVHVQDVPGRSLILMHWGNFANLEGRRDTRGCILLGSPSGFCDLNHDGCLDITSSRRAVRHLMATLAAHECESFHLRIVS